MTDSQAMRLADRLSDLNYKMCKMVHELSSHPNGEEMIKSLRDNGYDNPANADDVVSSHLLRSTKWKKVNYQWRFQP